MRVMGVSRERAAAVSSVVLPPYPPLDIDFTFVLGDREGAAGAGEAPPTPARRGEQAAEPLR